MEVGASADARAHGTTTRSHDEDADAPKRSRFDEDVPNVPFAAISAKEEDASSNLGRKHDHDGGKEATTRGPGVVEALRPAGRNRKGSLRQNLLGMNVLRRGPQEDLQPSVLNDTTMAETILEEETTPRPANHQHATHNSSSDIGRKPPAAASVSASTTRSSSYELDDPTTGMLASPLARSATPYASTTDDDEAVPFVRLSDARGYAPGLPAAAGAALHRRPNRLIQHAPPSTVPSPTDLALEAEWDYSETEWWGWIILIGTWVVFVVGMGSCLGVWSWAWDVGETPYAPPELENDDTLPITGYYPALIVCTAVMAWVWVVVAWVGMKYFRHSKMVGDDG